MSLVLVREWYTAAELAGLPGLPGTAFSVRRLAGESGWTNRPRAGRGGGLEFHRDSLPATTRAHLTAAASSTVERPTWQDWERATDKRRAAAEARVAALRTVESLRGAGASTAEAVAAAAAQHDVSAASLWSWRAQVRDLAPADWAPALLPGWKGGGAKAEIPEEAWEYFKGDYLRLEQPTATMSWERTVRAAKANGWGEIPSTKTFTRRLQSLPRAAVVLAREGSTLLDRLVPQQERDRSVFRALEAVCSDGHQFDVFVRWPDNRILRVVIVAWMDLYSGKILAWRIDETENAHTIRLSFGDLVQQWGIPDHAYLDNGRGFASKWLTGGVPNRYRFKVREEDPAGILPLLGTQTHFVTPYHGQAKPIERAWRDLAESVSRHPRCAGAYTGPNTQEKPENYAATAVPLDDFLALVEGEIQAHNARPGRRGGVCEGRSFDEVFAESYGTTEPRRATQAQRALWLLAAERITTSRESGEIRLLDNRYWCEQLVQVAGAEVVVRFDPQALHGSVLVYSLAGALLGEAQCVARVGFNDAGAAKDQARLKARRRRAAREVLDVERRLDATQVAAQLPGAARQESSVVRLARPARAQLVAAEPEAEAPVIDREAAEQMFVEQMRLAGGL